jgi:choline kinase
MKAIIMAAGRATRMLPLTKDKPKCILEIKGKKILQHQIDVLKKCGVKNIVVITGHEAEKIEKEYGKELNYVFNPFYNVSGMLITLWTARNELDDDILLMYSDILFNEKIIKKILDCEGDIALAVDTSTVDKEAEKVIIENGLILEISKTNFDVKQADAEYIGLAKFSKKGAKILIKEMERAVRKNINTYFIETIKNIINKNIKIMACDITGEKWIDIDFPEDLERAKNLHFV